jgi:hypothetical protein
MVRGSFAYKEHESQSAIRREVDANERGPADMGG